MSTRHIRKRNLLSALVALLALSGAYVPQANANGHLQIGATTQANARWKPNPDRGSASSTLSGGRRGSACGQESATPETMLTLLVPAVDELALTTQAQPTLSWLLNSEGITDMEFMLSNPSDAEPVYSQKMSASEGLVKLTLPESVELKEGIRYRWTVFMTCEGGHEVDARSFIKRVSTDELPADMNAMTEAEQADIYASHGIWYDALSTLVSDYQENTQVSTLTEIRSLLEQVGFDVPEALASVAAS